METGFITTVLNKNTLLKLDLRYSDRIDVHFNYRFNEPVTLKSIGLRNFLAKIKQVVKLSETRDLRIRNN